MSNLKSRYKKVDGKYLIEVRVKDAQRLFDNRDPAPFRERELDSNFVEYIYQSVREFPIAAALKLVIHIESGEEVGAERDAIREAIRSFLSYQVELQESGLKQFWNRAQLFLLIGVLFLVGCLAISQSLVIVPAKPGMVGILRDGLVIFGWVSVWKPIEVILFEWYPPLEQLRYYRKLLNSEVDIYFTN